ncbi:MAG: ATP-dependent Zn protease [Scytolyngbya sp. HA4215-MV1]|jgi:hypothetical protein|nr:ATP-dependent Zn protease [Scytolyngbya sp. HA4215-MV1]
MNQAALNLIAILIFAMTLSSLLGPWLHISPWITAIATAGILGFATLDNFSWQGRGANLVLDWMAGFSSDHRERVIRHEAGHFLVAHQLQIPIMGYTLTAWETLKQGQPGLGGVQFDVQALDAELQQGKLSAQLLDRYCAIWMAGMAAEDLTYGNIQGGSDDCRKLRSVLASLRYVDAQIAQKERWAALQARTILQENQSAYQALTHAMQQRSSISDCYHAIEQNLGAVDSL